MTIYISLIRDHLQPGFNSAKSPLAYQDRHGLTIVWVVSGIVEVDRKTVEASQSRVLDPKHNVKSLTSAVDQIRFTLSNRALTPSVENGGSEEASHSELLMSKPVQIEPVSQLFRLDQVDFPPGAVAYKHTHPGPGIRFLVDGELTLRSEHGTTVYGAGDAWFEDANQPVMAKSTGQDTGFFVRAMLLPIEFAGKPTFTLCDKNDADKPKRQTNTRHMEFEINLETLV